MTKQAMSRVQRRMGTKSKTGQQARRTAYLGSFRGGRSKAAQRR